VHLYDPHMPYQPPAPFRDQYKGRSYDGEIAYTDHELSRLFDAVHKKTPPDKTLIAVLSDHGESLGEHGEYSHGIFLYEATLRIPADTEPASVVLDPDVWLLADFATFTKASL